MSFWPHYPIGLGRSWLKSELSGSPAIPQVLGPKQCTHFLLFDRVAHKELTKDLQGMELQRGMKAMLSVMAMDMRVTSLEKGLEALHLCVLLSAKLSSNSLDISHRHHWKWTLLLHMTTRVLPIPAANGDSVWQVRGDVWFVVCSGSSSPTHAWLGGQRLLRS